MTLPFILLALLAAQPATGSPPVGSPSVAASLDGLSPEGRAALERAMAAWGPKAAAAREAARVAETEIAAAGRTEPLDLPRLRTALTSRDEGEAEWRRERTELGLRLVEGLPEADRAIAARLIAGIVAPLPAPRRP